MLRGLEMFYADEEPITDGEYAVPGHRDLAVGWLEAGRAFETGDCPPPVVAAIERACTDPVMTHRGFESCALSPEHTTGFGPMPYQTITGEQIFLGHTVARIVTDDGRSWLAPSMVLHYIEAHRYLPPAALLRGLTDR